MGLISRVSSRTYRKYNPSMVKHIIELIVRSARVTIRALQKTAAEEAAAAKTARAQRLADKAAAAEEAKNPKSSSDSNNKKAEAVFAAVKNQMQLKEATDILDVDIFPDMKAEEILAIQNKYDKMYSNNIWVAGAKQKPTYMQSKIYRAKERVDTELRKSGHDLEAIFATVEK